MPYIILFIAIAVALVLITLILFFYPRIKSKKLKKDCVVQYGKRIYKYALHNDLYLINKLELKSNDDQILRVDHLLFGTKYIYLIKDYYLPGQIFAKEQDRSFVYKSNEKNSKKVYIDNPMIKNKQLVNKVAANIGLDRKLFISIVLYNEETDFVKFVSTSKDSFMVKTTKLKRLLDSLESQKISPLNDSQLKHAVKDVAKLNLRNNEK